MSYNLMVEGDLDLFELSTISLHYLSLELFPIPADDLSPDDALGIAIPSSRATPDTVDELCDLIARLLAKQLAVHDLIAGVVIASDAALPELRARILG